MIPSVEYTFFNLTYVAQFLRRFELILILANIFTFSLNLQPADSLNLFPTPTLKKKRKSTVRLNTFAEFVFNKTNF